MPIEARNRPLTIVPGLCMRRAVSPMGARLARFESKCRARSLPWIPVPRQRSVRDTPVHCPPFWHQRVCKTDDQLRSAPMSAIVCAILCARPGLLSPSTRRVGIAEAASPVPVAAAVNFFPETG
jgi:hypothetical protein